MCSPKELIERKKQYFNIYIIIPYNNTILIYNNTKLIRPNILHFYFMVNSKSLQNKIRYIISS